MEASHHTEEEDIDDRGQISDSEDSEDLFFKVLITGNSGVGKSSIFKRYTENTFQDGYTPTNELDFKDKIVDIYGKTAILQLWDMGGHEKSMPAMYSFYRDSHAIIFVYDVTNQESFDQLSAWMKEVDAVAKPDACRVIVGNKSDNSDARVVEFDSAKEFAAEAGVRLIEVSAKTGDDIDILFEDILTIDLMEMFEKADDIHGGRMQFSKGSRRLMMRRSACCSIL